MFSCWKEESSSILVGDAEGENIEEKAVGLIAVGVVVGLIASGIVVVGSIVVGVDVGKSVIVIVVLKPDSGMRS